MVEQTLRRSGARGAGDGNAIDVSVSWAGRARHRDRMYLRAAREGRPFCTREQERCPRRGRARSEEHTSELQSLMRNSYADFCLKNKKCQCNTASATTDQQETHRREYYETCRTQGQ